MLILCNAPLLIFPAPNVYNVPPVLGNCPEGTKKKAPAYSIAGRGKEFVDFRVTNPGPGKYDSGNLDSVKQKSPRYVPHFSFKLYFLHTKGLTLFPSVFSYSLSVRTVMPSDDTKKPGPGNYSPEKVRIGFYMPF